MPYAAQFATPSLIHAYIHDGLDGAHDPNRAAFGADHVDPSEYTFWAHRACAIACVKMAIDAFQSAPPVRMWQLIQDGLALGGYRVHDEDGAFVDQGWFYPALAELAAHNGLRARGMAYASTLDVCAAVREGWIVAAAVTPELGEHGPLRRYDGHFAIVYGFAWRNGRPERFSVHNPSGRHADLQASALIPAGRFGRAFAHRFIALRRAEDSG